MIFSKQLLIDSIKKFSITTLIGTITLISTQALVTNELNASTSIPTSYNLAPLYSAMNREIPAGYVKTDYKINLIDPNTSPSSSELSVDEAAEIMAQEIFRFSKQDLSNKSLDMLYQPTTTYTATVYNNLKHEGEKQEQNTSPASWDCNLTLSDCNIQVSIDSSTGELFCIHYVYPQASAASSDSEDPRAIDSKIKKIIDEAEKNFNANKSQIIEKSKSMIIQAGYLADPIKEIKMNAPTYDLITNSLVYHVKVTTTTDHEYLFQLSEDLSRFTEVMRLDD